MPKADQPLAEKQESREKQDEFPVCGRQACLPDRQAAGVYPDVYRDGNDIM